MKLTIFAAVIVVGVVILGSPKTTHSSSELGRYQIAVAPGKGGEHLFDTIYRVDTATGEVCYTGGSSGPADMKITVSITTMRSELSW